MLFDTCSESFIQRGDHGIEPVDVCSHSDEMSNSQFRYQKAQQVEIWEDLGVSLRQFNNRSQKSILDECVRSMVAIIHHLEELFSFFYL